MRDERIFAMVPSMTVPLRDKYLITHLSTPFSLLPRQEPHSPAATVSRYPVMSTTKSPR